MTRPAAIPKILLAIVTIALGQPAGIAWAGPSAKVTPESPASPGTAEWDERSAVAAFLAESPLVGSVSAAADVGRAGLIGAGVWPNPALQAAREQIFSATGGAVENTVGVQVPFPVGEKLSLARRIAGSAKSVADARAEAQLQEHVREFREALALAYFASARREAIAAAATAYARVEKIVEARVAAGEEARYDLKRLRLARAGLSARLAAQEAAALDAMATVGGLLGRPVQGRILLVAPGDRLPRTADLAALLASHPDLRVLREERQRSLAGRELAELRSWPDPTLALGLKQAEGGLGYTAGVAWPLPVSDRAQGDVAIAGAEAASWEAQERALNWKLGVELEGAMEALSGRLEAEGAYARDTSSLIPDLVRIAEAAYREGQGTILGLLDAHEAALAARLEHLVLLEEVQAARLRVERILGRPFALSDWRKS